MPTSTAREIEQSEVVLLTVDDVCGRLRQSRRTVYKLIGTGELPSLTLGASRRIPSSALNAYIASLIARSSGAAEEVRAA